MEMVRSKKKKKKKKRKNDCDKKCILNFIRDNVSVHF
jgi:hypothetical protein